MEKDSFESALQKIILRSDEDHQQTLGKERVWAGVNRKKPTKKWWFYAAAVLILSLTIGFFSIKSDQIPPSIVKKEIKPQEKPVKRTIIVDEPILSAPRTTGTTKKAVVKKNESRDSIKLPNPLKIVLSPQLPKEEIVAITQKPVENTPIVIEKIDSQSEFSVQFKRGKTIEKQTITPIAFKKLSFGRDTSNFANANIDAKSNNPLKIKF